ncbi:hypothetical protein F3N42_05725 [Marinihelvus fidelis]|uniref:Uncharacterized protein n=1 Tax=Marinihelvus fidelis TaxID=2613842 RepID=A0A5N0TCF5_9GAMM|nr:hypothetical protein [Marinihelvus fidelis]KAA9132712.1 hypothetical protein F3N42_05725 [Marinihelvus fidelis]
MISAWRRQARELERLRAQRLTAVGTERARRARLILEVESRWLQAETLLWTAVTGWIWFSRRRDLAEEERGGLVAELIASLFIMQRWRRLSQKARRTARRASGDGRTGDDMS